MGVTSLEVELSWRRCGFQIAGSTFPRTGVGRQDFSERREVDKE